MTRTTILGKSRVRWASVGALSASLVLVAPVVTGCGGAPPPQPTARVERGTVSTKVTGSGALAAITSQTLGFKNGAQLKELDVKVGDLVRPGQVLAREDDFYLRQTLNNLIATLNNQQAQLNKIIFDNPVDAARRSLEAARRVLEATIRNVHDIVERDEAAVRTARFQLDFDERQLEQARNNPNYCSGGSTGTSTTGSTTTSPQRTLMGLTQSSSGSASNQQCVSAAARQVVQDKTALITAEHTLDVDRSQGQISIDQARVNVVTAVNNLESARLDRPSLIAAQAALVAGARAQVAGAQRDVESTVLYSPVAGTVSTINGTIGEFMVPSTSTTPLAPGTDASIPGVGAAATSAASSSASNINPTRPGVGSFLTLNNVHSFQVVVPFEESDASKVAPNMPVDLTFDAVPDLTRRGTVLTVAPSGTAISGVTNYYATIVINETDPRLHDGQTTEANVLTSHLDNVLSVPNAAVIKQGGRTFVNTPGPDGKPVLTPFQAGMVGDDRTQVLSGLTEGQPIILPQTTPRTGGGG
ncbi:MAG: hypothetical protein JO100_07400 [Pseudonocardia sp.]|nr:hypothetical protein [Pseudonocardia sp.]